MKEEFLMGNSDGLRRSRVSERGTVSVSEGLYQRLLVRGIDSALGFYCDFFGKDIDGFDSQKMVLEYLAVLEEARGLDLFRQGGVREKDHLNMWVLGNVLNPDLYVESGVYIGSSLHAFASCSGISDFVAVDPDLSKLRLSSELIDKMSCRSDKDFSEIDFGKIPEDSLVYFDDHINTASRILQSVEKGFSYLLIDDSTGYEGVVQRLYPAIPTVQMIRYYEDLQEGDSMEWFFQNEIFRSSLGIKERLRGTVSQPIIRLNFEVTADLIESCRLAFSKVARIVEIPDLGRYFPPSGPQKMVSTEKFLLELKR